MSTFTQIPLMWPLPDGKHWVQVSGFRYWIGEERDEPVEGAEFFDVPGGIITDLNSTPRLFRSFIGRWGKHGPAALGHDWLYFDQQISYYMIDRAGRLVTRRRKISRKRADKLYLEMMEVLNVGWATKKAAYRAVDLRGRGTWEEHQERKETEGISYKYYNGLNDLWVGEIPTQHNTYGS